jgi:hypothetical protein
MSLASLSYPSEPRSESFVFSRFLSATSICLLASWNFLVELSSPNLTEDISEARIIDFQGLFTVWADLLVHVVADFPIVSACVFIVAAILRAFAFESIEWGFFFQFIQNLVF